MCHPYHVPLLGMATFPSARSSLCERCRRYASVVMEWKLGKTNLITVYCLPDFDESTYLVSGVLSSFLLILELCQVHMTTICEAAANKSLRRVGVWGITDTAIIKRNKALGSDRFVRASYLRQQQG